MKRRDLERHFGKTASGKPITDELVTELSEKAEAGLDADDRPSAWWTSAMGAAAAPIEAVDSSLSERLPAGVGRLIAGAAACPRTWLA